MATALEMKREEWQRYNPGQTMEARRAQRGPLEERRRQALETARQAAALLRQDFGAQKVVAFGSVIIEEAFTAWSDIDLAAWGIPAEKFYAAVAAVTGLSPVFKIDLVEPDNCRAPVRKAILDQGMSI